MPDSRTRKRARTGTDWSKVDALTDPQIEQMASADVDNPATTVDDWANGVVGLPPAKIPVNAKFDVDVVAWFKAQGRGYQTRMNAVLRHYMETHRGAG